MRAGPANRARVIEALSDRVHPAWTPGAHSPTMARRSVADAAGRRAGVDCFDGRWKPRPPSSPTPTAVRRRTREYLHGLSANAVDLELRARRHRGHRMDSLHGRCKSCRVCQQSIEAAGARSRHLPKIPPDLIQSSRRSANSRRIRTDRQPERTIPRPAQNRSLTAKSRPSRGRHALRHAGYRCHMTGLVEHPHRHQLDRGRPSSRSAPTRAA